MTTLYQELQKLEAQMENCVLQNRFDTFNQLASDRLQILKKAMKSPDKEALLALAREQTERWVELIDGRMGQMRLQRSQSKALAGYMKPKRSGRLINRAL